MSDILFGVAIGLALGSVGTWLLLWWRARKPRHVHRYGDWYEVPAQLVVWGKPRGVQTTMQVRKCNTCGWKQEDNSL